MEFDVYIYEGTPEHPGNQGIRRVATFHTPDAFADWILGNRKPGITISAYCLTHGFGSKEYIEAHCVNGGDVMLIPIGERYIPQGTQ